MDHSPLSTAVLIGGPAAAGKTSVGRLLARKHGMRWYSTDAHAQHHRAIAVARGLHAEDDPAPGTFDRGPLINDDLVRLAAEPPEAGVVVEGALITPDLAPLPRSVWLMPSTAEQRRRLVERSGSSDIHHGLLYGHTIVSEQLADTPANVIMVDGQTVTETIEAVEVDLATALAELPRARTRMDRRRVIRYGNRTLTEQLTNVVNRGHVDGGDPDVIRTFDCECGRADCCAMVRLRPWEATARVSGPPGAIRAVGHHL